MKICGFMKTTLLDYPEHIACTIFTGGCNFRCPYCHNSELLDMDLPSRYSEEEILSYLKKRKDLLEGVVISGGEPTLQKDLPEFIGKVKGSTGLDVKLDTNGSDPKMLKKLGEEGLIDFVSMDIKSGEGGYMRAAGLKGANAGLMEKIKESRDYLINGSLPYEFRTTVAGGLHTEADIAELGIFIKGCGHFYIQAYKESGMVLDLGYGLTQPSVEELKTYAEILAPYAKSVGIRGVDLD